MAAAIDAIAHYVVQRTRSDALNYAFAGDARASNWVAPRSESSHSNLVILNHH